MNKMYDLNFSEPFLKRAKKLLKKNPDLKSPLQKTLHILGQDPFYPSLNSHKVNTKSHGEAYSSWVTNDVRVIWHFNDDKADTLDIINLGGHSGSDKVYK